MWRETPILWSHLVGALLYATLLTLALESRSGSKSLVEGLKVGAIVGLLVWGTADFTYYGLTIINTLTGAVADVVLEGVRAGIAGGVIAAVLGKIGD